jgi:glyoxylase-like metal-dependent hydrolase (beta-lactamase superfamily II)
MNALPSDTVQSYSLGEIKIHALQTGLVKIKKSHFHSGIRTNFSLLDPKWTTWLPVYSWLVEKEGDLTLVDTGVTGDMKDLDYFKDGTINGWVNSKIVRFELRGFPSLPTLLTSLGYGIENISRVIITHFHLDHVAGLSMLGEVPVWVCGNENRNQLGVMEKSIPKSVNWLFADWLPPRVDLPFFHAPVNGDQDILIIQTPGHTPGHQSLLIRNKDVHLLLAGDVTYNLEQLINEEVPGISANRNQALETIRSIKLYAVKNKLVYLPSHDPGVPDRMAKLEPVNFEQ